MTKQPSEIEKEEIKEGMSVDTINYLIEVHRKSGFNEGELKGIQEGRRMERERIKEMLIKWAKDWDMHKEQPFMFASLKQIIKESER